MQKLGKNENSDGAGSDNESMSEDNATDALDLENASTSNAVQTADQGGDTRAF